MNVNENSLQKLEEHWAIKSISQQERIRGKSLLDLKLVKQAIGRQVKIENNERKDDDNTLLRLALAYEIAAIEGLNTFLNPTSEKTELREQCAAGAWRAFEFRRILDIPEKDEEKIYSILHTAALAFSSERWVDLKRWLTEQESLIKAPSVAEASWDRRLLYRLFECWIRLFRKKNWDDLDEIREIIAGLRQDQKEYEQNVLNNTSETKNQMMACRLIALYHWAKSTELLSIFMLQGEPPNIASLLDKHFEAASSAATSSHDSQLEMLLRWLHASSRQMVAGSVWWVARSINSMATKFINSVTKQQGLFDLLPPQRAALQEHGLLDQAATAIVIELPTSGGKTLLAQFRMLQAINQFDSDNGWIAYVAPTRALTAQITRRLRRDFEPIGIIVEQLTSAVEVDTFEEDMLSMVEKGKHFQILVATPEKLQIVIRNKKISRPLTLVVMDEAHNIEDESRGLRIELLLASIKRECTLANFLLLMPYVEKAEVLSRWLAHDVNAAKSISFGTSPWRPNERIVGMYKSEKDESVRGGWKLTYRSLITTPGTIHLEGAHQVGGTKPLAVSKSKLSLSLETAAMAQVFSNKGTSIAVATTINSAWNMARELCKVYEPMLEISDEVLLVQNFLKTEISHDFELIEMLSKGIGVHHAGLSDDIRGLIEWLVEEGKLRILCATTTIAQGINFPVSSVFLASRFIQQKGRSTEMTPRDFWNLAGRAGRINHDSVGVVGLAMGDEPEKIIDYVSRATGQLVSRLVKLLTDLDEAGRLHQLEKVLKNDEWNDFRCYIAHLLNEKKNLDTVLAETEQLLRNTLGYNVLRNSDEGKLKAEELLNVTKKYIKAISKNPSVALTDSTGFTPEGVVTALTQLNKLEHKLTLTDWEPESLFGKTRGMADLFGVMLHIPQLESLKDLGGKGETNQNIAEITKAWVGGLSIKEIAHNFFKQEHDDTKAITDACKAIYRSLANVGTWGVSALTKLSGIDFNSLSQSEKRRINSLPAMMYHGVNTEEAVLMRMNSVPRSIAVKLGEQFKETLIKPDVGLVEVRHFLRNLNSTGWDKAKPEKAYMTGSDYKRIWEVLSGENV